MRNATELAIPDSPTSLSSARATASVVIFFASTAAATVISTVARTITIASATIAVDAFVTKAGGREDPTKWDDPSVAPVIRQVRTGVSEE